MTERRPYIVFYTENTVVGGSERYLRDLTGSLVDQGYEVRLGCNPDPGLLAFASGIRPGLSIDTLPVHTLSRSTAFQVGQATGAGRSARLRWLKPVGAAVVRLLQFALNVIILYRWLSRQRPEILHINNGGYPGGESCRAAAVAGRLAGIPVVSMFVHNLAEPRRWPAVVEAALDRLISRCLDTMIAASQASATTLIRRRGFPRLQLTCIPYGIALPQPGPAPTAGARERLGLPGVGLLIGSVARLEPRKGQNYLLQAVAMVRRTRDDTQAVIVGSGPSDADLRTLARSLDIADATVFTGQRGDVENLMRAFDIFVMPSVDFESLPFALLEAMSLGLPVVATRVAGMPEAVQDGRTGLLVAPRDVRGLAQALLRLLRDEDERRRLGQAARARAEAEYSMARMVERTVDHYARLLRASSRTR